MKRLALAFLVTLLASCSGTPRPGGMAAPDRQRMEAALAVHVGELASDAYEGRKPGTEGEARTLRYLAGQWQQAGLQSGTNDPANPWFAPVDLALGTPSESEARFYARGRRGPIAGIDAWLFTPARQALVDRAPVVFASPGAGPLDRAEVAGRVVLMLWDQPHRREQRENLLDMGAAAVLAIVADEQELAELVARQRLGSYHLADEPGAAVIEGFMTLATARTLAGEGALEKWQEDESTALHRLPVEASLSASSAMASVRTHNLIARLPGRDPAAGAVLLLAHWDHFGVCGDADAADPVCNGAVDNASGLAVLTEIARSLAAAPQLDRDVYFLASTAEEWGLLGARAFAQEPPVPLDSIVAAFNIDMLGLAPAGGPVAVIGRGMTGLDADVDSVIAQTGRSLGDDDYAASFVRRQDGWALLQRDVPTLGVSSTFAVRPTTERFLRSDYHRPGDETDKVDFASALDDLLLHLALVRHFASRTSWPGRAAAVTEESAQ